MANPQTTESQQYELLGAVQIELSADGVTWTDLGAVTTGTVITENSVYSNLENENASDRDSLTDQTATVELNRLEIYNDTIEDIMRGSIDLTTNVAGVLVSAASQTKASGSWSYDKFFPITNQNGDGTIITPTSVTGGTDGLLVEDTDYFVIKNDSGISGIYIIDSATVTTEAQDIVIIYDYTPNASTIRTTGGLNDVDNFQLRLTNVETIQSVARTVQYQFYKCNLASGMNLEIKKYNDEDTRVIDPTTINAKQDITRTIGDRLYKRTITPPIA
jgi:hypothetical protein